MKNMSWTGESDVSFSELRELFAQLRTSDDLEPDHRPIPSEELALDDLASLTDRHDPLTAARIKFGHPRP